MKRVGAPSRRCNGALNGALRAAMQLPTLQWSSRRCCFEASSGGRGLLHRQPVAPPPPALQSGARRWPAADIEERAMKGGGRVLLERCRIRKRAKRRSRWCVSSGCRGDLCFPQINRMICSIRQRKNKRKGKPVWDGSKTFPKSKRNKYGLAHLFAQGPWGRPITVSVNSQKEKKHHYDTNRTGDLFPRTSF